MDSDLMWLAIKIWVGGAFILGLVVAFLIGMVLG